MTSIDNLLFIFTFVAAMGSGLMTGLFFVFSTSVMSALAQLRPAEGIAAMQSINRTIINPVFALVFWGTSVACLLLLIFSILDWQGLFSLFLLAGSICYLVGGLLVTLIIHVPMNNNLASVTPADPSAVLQWEKYVKRWARWNHLRTVLTLAALALFIISLKYIF